VRSLFPTRVVLAVAVGGAAGTLLRALIAEDLPVRGRAFPWATLAVNLGGSLILGFVLVATVSGSAYARPLLATGFCGGLTTFSTLVVEVDLLVRAGRAGTAAVYLGLSMLGGLVAVWAGTRSARLIGL
jgi:fluoride exporter